MRLFHRPGFFIGAVGNHRIKTIRQGEYSSRKRNRFSLQTIRVTGPIEFFLVMANNFLQLFFGWEAVGLVSYFVPAGKFSILWDKPNWPVVDPLFVALPVSALVILIVSLMTAAPDEAHLAKCFPAVKPK